jgi:hypothetical protein
MLPEIRIGQPVNHGALNVFPLFCEENHPVEYVLSDEGIEAGTVTVAEVTEQGRVPNLTVENKGDKRALFLEGEELRGAKQNRILNTSVLVSAQAKLTLPVSCVEHGRWRKPVPSLRPAKPSAHTVCATGLKAPSQVP